MEFDITEKLQDRAWIAAVISIKVKLSNTVVCLNLRVLDDTEYRKVLRQTE